jgi:hypothetical protein
MARKCGQPIHGWVNIDKPKGISSAKAVAIVMRVFDAAKAGHGGTLDPLASGVLPIALGEATKTVSFAMGQQKSYEFELAWGSETSTDDGEGSVIRQSDHRPNAATIDAALEHYQGHMIWRERQEMMRRQLHWNRGRFISNPFAALPQTRTLPDSMLPVAKAPISARWRAILGAILARRHMSPRLGGFRSDNFMPIMRFHWIF